MHCIRRHPFPLHDPGQLLTKVYVGQLAAAVGEEGQQIVVEVLEVQLLVFVVGACERDHPTGGTLLQARKQQISKEEVAQVVDPETHAESVVCPIKNTGHTWRDRKRRVIKGIESVTPEMTPSDISEMSEAKVFIIWDFVGFLDSTVNN